MALSQSNNHKFQSGELVTSTKLNNVKVVQTDTESNNDGFLGSEGQLTYDTTNDKLRVHDGQNAGGAPLVKGPVQSADIASGAITSTQLATDAVTSAKIADNAVTSDAIADNAVDTAKIADGAVSTTQLQESGEGAISIQQIVPKTVVIHVGNYYYQGTKYWASDLYNYNSSTDTYEARTSISRDFTAGTSVGAKAWGSLHYDLKEAVVIEPFATYIAGMRYVLQNHGVGANVTVIFHGHVCAYGTYDLINTTNAPFYKDVNNFENFAKISLQGGAPPDYSNNSADYQVIQSNGATPARIDHDNSVRHATGVQGRNLAYWYRGPIMNVVGTNQVFTSNTSASIEVRYGIGINHNLANNRMASAGSVSWFNPYNMLENTIAYFSSGSGNPNEFYFQNAGKCFGVFGASTIYSNNGVNNIYIDGANTSTNLIEFCSVALGSSFMFKNNSDVKYKSGKTFQAFGASQYPINLTGPFNQFTSVSDDFFVGENGIGHTGATLAEDYNYVSHDGSGTILTTATTGTPPVSNRQTYSDISSESGTLHQRYQGGGFISSLSTLNASRICGQSNVKSAPTSRTGTGGTSNSSAPYSDQ
jgi:hypothetical protein